MNWKSLLFGMLIGAIAIIGIGALTVAIGCAVNGIGFGEQIVQWVQQAQSAKEVVEEAPGLAAAVKMLI